MLAKGVFPLMQWRAMVITVVATWLVASTRPRRRTLSFWLFLVSNGLWLMWAVYTNALALAVLQLCLGALNIRASQKSQDIPAR